MELKDGYKVYNKYERKHTYYLVKDIPEAFNFVVASYRSGYAVRLYHPEIIVPSQDILMEFIKVAKSGEVDYLK